ncbi:MAG TPA: MFS transporter [Allosphingosinicella sp.]|nr:MFS transporter [Allosphingosinicella sp.]
MSQIAGERRRAHAPRASTSRSGLGRLTGGIVVAALFMGSTLLTPLYDLYRSDYRFSALMLVLLYAVYVVGNLAALLFFGRLSDQIGRKPMLFAGLALAAASAILFLAAQGLATLFAGRIVNGLAVGIGAGAATAWITEFMPAERRTDAASLMTSFNFAGLALGPLLAGPLVQYAPAPLRLPFIAYLALLAGVGVLAAIPPETLAERAPLSLAPRLGVPRGARLAFLAPAATGFCAMAVVGFYAALGPTTIRDDLHIANRAAAGAIVAELFIVAAVLILATRRVSARAVMRAGLIATPIGLALLVLGERTASVPILLVATAACGIAGALGYRGGLAVANDLAPPERRAEIASLYFVCVFCGNALPVIGVGILVQAASPPVADLAFACLISAIAVAALAASLAMRTRA